jgi:very-short-patch-repair endonuclease
MTNWPKSYSLLSIEQKAQILQELYVVQQKSFADIALEYNTYPNKVRRDAVSLNIKIRNKSEAQKNALNSGKHKHPTKGSQRSESTKNKIGMSVMKAWDSLSDAEIAQRKQKSKEAWDSLDEETKKQITNSAHKAVRQSSKTGSKLEAFLLSKLIEDGYKVEFHKEQTLSNTKLQIDLFVPKISTVIEVDGPSHFLPVWGEETLKRNVSYDQKKEGLILGKGMVLIRIKQTKDFSKSRSLLIYDKLKNILKSIEQEFPKQDQRKFSIKD